MLTFRSGFKLVLRLRRLFTLSRPRRGPDMFGWAVIGIPRGIAGTGVEVIGLARHILARIGWLPGMQAAFTTEVIGPDRGDTHTAEAVDNRYLLRPDKARRSRFFPARTSTLKNDRQWPRIQAFSVIFGLR